MSRSSALASLFLGPALVLACAFPARAQVVQKYVFNDTAPYTPDELLATAGLKVGQRLGTNSLGDAAQKLMNTGLFDDAEVTYKGPLSGYVVTFKLKLKPKESLLPVSFENLVWFTPQELADGIHAQVPLYHGYASDAGTLPDDIQAALEQMLKAKNVQATLLHVQLEPGGPVTHSIINFSVEQPKIYLAQIDLRGLDTLPPDVARTMQSLIQSLSGQPYNESPEQRPFTYTLLFPARDAGYATADFTAINRIPTIAARGIDVTFQAQLMLGALYKVGAVQFAADSVVGSAEFASADALHVGDNVSQTGIEKTVAALTNAYKRQGYLYAAIQVDQHSDDAAHTIAYTFTPIAGDQYRLKSLTVNGLQPTARAAFDAQWKMKPGDLYDGTYFEEFLKSTIAAPPFINPATGVAHYAGAKLDAQPNKADYTVDVTINYLPTGR